MKTYAQMDTRHKGKVRGQRKMRAQQFTCDPIIISSFVKFRPVVTEEFSGHLCGGGGRGGGGGGGRGVQLKT